MLMDLAYIQRLSLTPRVPLWRLCTEEETRYMEGESDGRRPSRPLPQRLHYFLSIE